jgi:hypothetical protein
MELQASRQVKFLIILAALAIAAVASGCYVRGVGWEVEWEVDVQPPPLQSEVVLEAPGPNFIWVPGYWDWDVRVRHYAWKAGRYERPPRRGARWEPPRHEVRGNRHYYHPGHWR